MLGFYFGSGAKPKGFQQVAPTTIYSQQSGYGFESSRQFPSLAENGDSAQGSSVCSDKPFFFSVALPEGTYSVALTLGDRNGPSTTTVKAESRRLLIEKVQTAPGQFEKRKFTINVRTPEIAWGGHVELKPRELGAFDWDDKLTLEFNNTRPCISSLEITKATDAVTVYIAGDSTVVDQTDEPWAAWGQILPRFFAPGVAVSNQAESGESLKSFIRERRLDKILSTIKAGDYLFIQFTHNDQKQGGKHDKTYVEAFTTYKAYLNVFVQEARLRGAIPVLVTSMNRRSFGADGKIQNTLGDYPEAMRRYAREENVPLIDLNSMSKAFYEALGPEQSVKAFVHYPAGTFPRQTEELKDDTHFNAYGAYELAKCVVEGIKKNHLDLAKSLIDDPPFDPSHPDPVQSVNIPASPFNGIEAPFGK